MEVGDVVMQGTQTFRVEWIGIDANIVQIAGQQPMTGRVDMYRCYDWGSSFHLAHPVEQKIDALSPWKPLDTGSDD